VGDVPYQASRPFGTSAAVGTGLGGLAVLAALAALLLLLFLMKKKTNLEVDADEAEETLSETQTADDHVSVSHSGLSDGVRPMNDRGDQEDLPRTIVEGEEVHSDVLNASEHNPDELDKPDIDVDEASIFAETQFVIEYARHWIGFVENGCSQSSFLFILLFVFP
jgi:hypothetical protein